MVACLDALEKYFHNKVMVLEAFGVESVTVTITIYKTVDMATATNTTMSKCFIDSASSRSQLSRHFFPGHDNIHGSQSGSLQKATSGRNMVESFTRMRK